METITYEVKTPTSLDGLVKEAKKIAIDNDCAVAFTFGYVKCILNKDTNERALMQEYLDACATGWTTIGPVCRARYDIDTEIDLYTRRLHLAKTLKAKEHRRLIEACSIEAPSYDELLSDQEIDGLLERYTHIAFNLTNQVDERPIMENILVHTSSFESKRVFCIDYDFDKGYYSIHLVPSPNISHSLKISAKGYKDLHVDIKAFAGKTNQFNLQMTPDFTLSNRPLKY